MLFIVDDRFIFHLLTYEIARFCVCVLIILIICCYFRSSGSVTNPILQFAEKYGKVFSLRILGSRIVVLDGYKLVKEVYLRHDDSLAGRPVLPLFYDIVGDKGQCNVWMPNY